MTKTGFIKKITVTFVAHILLTGIVLYTIRVILLSQVFTIPIKIGSTGELYFTRYFPYLLAIFLYIYLKKKKLSLIVLLLFIMLLVGRYTGIFLTFEEYIGKD